MNYYKIDIAPTLEEFLEIEKDIYTKIDALVDMKIRIGTVLGIFVKIASILNTITSIIMLGIWIMSYTDYRVIIADYTGFWYDISTNLFQLCISGLLTYKIISHKMKNDNSYIDNLKLTTRSIMGRIPLVIAENNNSPTITKWLRRNYDNLCLIRDNVDLSTDVKFITQKKGSK